MQSVYMSCHTWVAPLNWGDCSAFLRQEDIVISDNDCESITASIFSFYFQSNNTCSCLSSRLPFSIFERFFHLRSEKMAAIPSSGSLIATHDYYRSESDVAYMHLYCIHFSQMVFHSASDASIFYFRLWWDTHRWSSFTKRVRLFIAGRLGSNSSNSSCGSAEYTGEVIPHHPGIKIRTRFYFSKCLHQTKFLSKLYPVAHRTPKARLWPLVDFIFLCKTEPARHAERIWKSKVSVVVSKHNQIQSRAAKFVFLGNTNRPLCCRNRTYTVANGQVTCIAREMVLNRQVSENSESGKSETMTLPPASS